MNCDSTPDNLHHLMDSAKSRAEQLRQEAISDFWDRGGEAARQALRSARRFAQSLARHQRLRNRQGA